MESGAVGSIKYEVQQQATTVGSRGQVRIDQAVSPLLVYARDGDNRPVAGLTGGTYRGLAKVQRIWFLTEEDQAELSTQLIESFEGQLRARGCQFCMVDLDDRSTEAFFLAAGYVEMPLHDFVPGKNSVLVKRAPNQ